MPVRSQPATSPLEFGGLNTTVSPSRSYPHSPDCLNVRWDWNDQLLKRTGFTTYNSTAMGTTAAITGVFQFNRRDTTTRYTIVGDKDRIWVAPTSGAWTQLIAGQAASVTDYYDAAVFNNEIILTNGVSAPVISDGTAGGTGTLSSQAAMQTRTSMTTTQSLTAGLHHPEDGILIGASGATVAGGYDGTTQEYDTTGDAWKTRIRGNVSRDEGSGFVAYGRVYVEGGNISGPALTATAEYYDLTTQSWRGITSIPTALRQSTGHGINNGGNIITGNNSAGAAGWVTTNQRYDPSPDTWSTVTAAAQNRRLANFFALSQIAHVAGGLISTGPDNTTTNHDEYNPFADAWTSLTVQTAFRRSSAGCGADDNLGYTLGGFDTAGTAQNTVYAYNRISNAWTTPAATQTTTRVIAGAGPDNWWVYEAGGAVGANASAVVDRLNVAPAAPTAFYVESVKGYVILARTTTFPSRVFYSTVGNSRVFDPFAFFDVNPDDGGWITGLFVFNGRLYVSKLDQVYEVPFTVLDPDPEIGNEEIIPLQNCPGTVSNRSIVVTDHGVYYLGKDGIRVFDGARSEDISTPFIGTTLAGYVQSRNKYCQGMWVKKYNEVWFSFTSTGSTHDRLAVWNYKVKKWSLFSGMNCEAMGLVEDANGNDQFLFGTGLATDGKLYLADSGNSDNAAAINGYYRTGWFALEPTSEAKGRYCYLFTRRSGNWSLAVDLYRNFDTSTRILDAGGTAQGATINLLSGTYTPDLDQYFPDANDQLTRIDMSMDGHHFQMNFSNANAGQPFEIYGAVFKGHNVRPAGQFL